MSLLILFGCSNRDDGNITNFDNTSSNNNIVETNKDESVDNYTTISELKIFDNIESIQIQLFDYYGNYNKCVLTFKSKDLENEFIEKMKNIENANIVNNDGSFDAESGRDITDKPDSNYKDNIENYYNDNYELKPFTIVINYAGSSVTIEQLDTEADGLYVKGTNSYNQNIKGYYYYNDKNYLTSLLENLLKDDLYYVSYVLTSNGDYSGICEYLHPIKYENDIYIIESTYKENVNKSSGTNLNRYLLDYIENNNFEIFEDGIKLDKVPIDGFHYLTLYDSKGNEFDLYYHDESIEYSTTYIPDYLHN